MDGDCRPLEATAGALVMRTQFRGTGAEAEAALSTAFAGKDVSLLVLFCNPSVDFEAVIGIASKVAHGVPIIGCTTAGEVGDDGYTDASVLALGLPASHFACELVAVDDLAGFDRSVLIRDLIRSRAALGNARPTWEYEFAFLLVDGLSLMEDRLVAAIASGLGPVPLFGGSAGDNDRFSQTLVTTGGKPRSNAAVIALVRTNCPIKVFSLDHLSPTATRMVVTEADTARRTVRKINAEPAAREYARLLGKDPDQLDTFTFAAHPVVVRIGGRHHVRSIQRVLENGDLVFFSAIDEGLVLTLAEAEDMVGHLDRELSTLSADGAPDTILACDCILRRIEAQDRQMTRAISDVLVKNRVIGFSTYGEQYSGMHVNQTMTGVAIYPPGASGG